MGDKTDWVTYVAVVRSSVLVTVKLIIIITRALQGLS